MSTFYYYLIDSWNHEKHIFNIIQVILDILWHYTSYVGPRKIESDSIFFGLTYCEPICHAGLIVKLYVMMDLMWSYKSCWIYCEAMFDWLWTEQKSELF